MIPFISQRPNLSALFTGHADLLERLKDHFAPAIHPSVLNKVPSSSGLQFSAAFHVFLCI